MMRKSRFGSKAGGEDRRDEDRDSGGSGSSDHGAGENGTDAGESGTHIAGTDRYERSSERAGASKSKSGWERKRERAGAETSASARRVSAGGLSRKGMPGDRGIGRDGTIDSPDGAEARSADSGAAKPPGRMHDAEKRHEDERAKRLEQARVLLEQTLAGTRRVGAGDSATSKAAGSNAARSDAARSNAARSNAARSNAGRSDATNPSATRTPRAFQSPESRDPPAFPDPFEDADPFEPFEQCVPASAASARHAVSPAGSADSGESIYSRSSETRRGTRNAGPAHSSSSEAKASKRPQRSLKGRALGYLSRREYSRAELSRKLVPFVEEADSLETLLDTLEREGWLSNERFVESVVHRRAGRMGASRIVDELKRHAVGDALIRQTGEKLSGTEIARARAVWSRKYGTPPANPAERAKQSRFLAARGFSGGTIAKVLKGSDDDPGIDPGDE
jgi:regulatory protein